MIWRKVAFSQVVLDALGTGFFLSSSPTCRTAWKTTTTSRSSPCLSWWTCSRASKTTRAIATLLQIIQNWAQVFFYKVKKQNKITKYITPCLQILSPEMSEKSRQGLETMWRQFCLFETEYTKNFENCVAKSPIVSPIVSQNQKVVHKSLLWLNFWIFVFFE